MFAASLSRCIEGPVHFRRGAAANAVIPQAGALRRWLIVLKFEAVGGWFGAVVVPLGAVAGPFGAVAGPFGSVLGPFEPVRGYKWLISRRRRSAEMSEISGRKGAFLDSLAPKDRDSSRGRCRPSPEATTDSEPHLAALAVLD